MTKTLEERILAIENSHSLTDLDSDVLPTSHQEDYYFVSYSHKDYKAVLTDILKLEAEGLNFWYDTDIHVGENWEYIAKTYISKFQCKGVIFYLSENSILSTACNKEIEYVRKKGLNYFSINLPLLDGNISCGQSMLQDLIASGKAKESNIDQDKARYLFSDCFNQDVIYLPFNAPTQAKLNSIKKTLKGRNLYEFRFKLETVNHKADTPVATLYACKDNAITEAKIPAYVSRSSIANMEDLLQYEEKTGKFFEELPLTHVEDTAVFANFHALESVDLPTTLTSLGSDAFRNCYSLEKINLFALTELFSIHARAFAGCTSLNVTAIPDTVFYLGDGAFENCTSLTSFTPSKGLRHLGNGAFENCVNLSSITLPNNLSNIGDSAFSRCESLTEICIPPSVLDIGSNAFYGCKNLRTFTMADSMTEFGYRILNNCEKLTNVKLSKYAENIPSYAFAGDVSLASFNIPQSVEYILDNAFKDCVKLESITIPNSVKEIFSNAFNGCAGLTNVFIPKGLTSLRAPFSNCENLTEIAVDKDNEVYYSLDGNVYSRDKELIQYAVGKQDATFIIPDNVVEIGISAFDGAKNLKSITIPSSVKKVGLWAFSGCSSLETIINHSGVVLDRDKLEISDKINII
ncbi:MAG: leucine-rich repeat protein [Clostridia bacterium]|nr:leucine-rich repeat protein [Clostridia bacterium]